MRRALQQVVVGAFLVLIALPLAANLTGVDGADPEAENRELARFPRPSASPAALAAFGSGLAAWFEDHFGFRARLVQWHGELRLFGLGVSPSPSVLRGLDDWFFYADDEAVEDFTNAHLLTADEITTWRQQIVTARNWCRAHHVAYVFTVAPDKHVLYPEKFPDDVRQLQPTSRTDQVLNGVSDTGVAVDLRPALFDAKRRERIYERTDTHWNERGAFAAYQQIVQAVRAQQPRVPPAWPRASFEPEAHTIHGLDLAGMMGLTRVLREEELRLTPRRRRQAVVLEPPGETADAEVGRLVTEIPGSTLPRAVIFRDSFTSALAPFLSEHFSRAVYLWRNDFDPTSIDAEHADVVIQEIVGRHLYDYVPTPELIPVN
jgi:alginate O-acetyltransferase complex protein AlgJ